MRLNPSFAPLLAIAAASASASVLRAPALAEEIHRDAAGNLVWMDNAQQQQQPMAELGRPDFSSHSHPQDVLQAEVMDGFKHFEEEMTGSLTHLLEAFEDKVHSATHAANGWLKEAESVWASGIEYQRFTHASFPSYALRVAKDVNGTVCDPEAKMISGYLDVAEDKHLWFALFESRSNPAKDPLQLWLNGGPGCSSSTGLLFELGPCRIANKGESVVPNPHSWNNKANLLFLDQPVNVGYSYGDADVNNTPAAAEDVYAFLQLFLQKFDKYSKLPFHVSGESYAGTYIPRIGAVIHEKNMQLAQRAVAGNGAVHVNLDSLLIGNGLTDPKAQFGSSPDFMCDKNINPYALFKNDSSTCTSLRAKAKTCTSLIDACYKYESRLTCLPAAIQCWSGVYGPAQDSGKNLYDLRRDCDRSPDADGPLCYREMEWMEVYMNKPEVKKAFGAERDVQFQSCNTDVNRAFLLQGDVAHDSSKHLPDLIAAGIRVGIYAGMADLMCHWYGNEQWTSSLEHAYSTEYAKSPEKEWTDKHNQTVGSVRSAGAEKGGFGQYAWIKIREAGHMVPMDQPELALKMVEAWREDKALV